MDSSTEKKYHFSQTPSIDRASNYRDSLGFFSEFNG